jgi:hypothetical protein
MSLSLDHGYLDKLLWYCNNSYGVDSAEAEQKLREKEPLLLHTKEHFQLAFKSAADRRDKYYSSI